MDRDELIRRYHINKNKWFELCLRYQNSPENAEDVLQNALIKMIQKIELFDPDKGDFGGWAYKLILNENLMFLRKNSGLKRTENLSGIESYEPESTVLESISKKEILTLVQKLPDGYRTVFNLFVIEGYSHKEISELLEISPGTSKSQLSKAKSLLRKQLEILYAL